MYLNSIEFAGTLWSVELTMEPGEEGTGLLRFRYSSAEQPEVLSWLASDETLERLARDGMEIGECLLRDQLQRALMLRQVREPITDSGEGGTNDG